MRRSSSEEEAPNISGEVEWTEGIETEGGDGAAFNDSTTNDSTHRRTMADGEC